VVRIAARKTRLVSVEANNRIVNQAVYNHPVAAIASQIAGLSAPHHKPLRLHKLSLGAAPSWF
jgi:hypothetical protein